MGPKNGFTVVEMLMVTVLFTIIATAGALLMVTASKIWSFTDTQVALQENLRQTLQRIGVEVQASGRDHLGVLRIAIVDNAGSNSSDILRFAVPLCQCGTSAMDSTSHVRTWGAPLIWNQSNCGVAPVVNGNGKVTICHRPPGNPNNENTLDVGASAVQAHLAHGDYVGECGLCSLTNYTNRTIEYRIDGSGQLLRRVLDANGNVLKEDVLALGITAFQVVIDGANNRVSVTVTVTGQTHSKRVVTLTGSSTLPLRNRG